MKIEIISLGKFKKNPPLKIVFDYYKKRINLNVDLIELKTYDYENKKKLHHEKKEIYKYLKDSDCVVVLDKNGKMLSSENFAAFFEKKMLNQTKKICFLIGSEIGLEKSLLNSKNVFSFGQQTWPHLLVRILLIEQIYRSMEILNGSSYHK